MHHRRRRDVAAFVRNLATIDVDRERVFHPWLDRCSARDLDPDAPARRRGRLTAHLSVDAPRLLIIGEAPGWQGCRYAGVPFTSEALMVAGEIPRIGRIPRLTAGPRPMKEPTATIVWQLLYELGLADEVVAWNAFPLHPHRTGVPLSNRPPTASELAAGASVLEAFVALFPATPIVAIGQKAADALTRAGRRPAASVRHPSRGGKPRFRVELSALADQLGFGDLRRSQKIGQNTA